MGVVLSGTAGVVLSGTGESSFREPRSARNPQKSAPNRGPSNRPNREEYFIFFLTRRGAVDFGSCVAALPSRRSARRPSARKAAS
ncbi:hypothetical protein BRX37_03735 [Sphingomonas sp. S-NIH.Pt3_0716]|nr:hypothetical protein BRX37_03735 [Sphingomonas sp. S-NIH.Pt3_0716]